MKNRVLHLQQNVATLQIADFQYIIRCSNEWEFVATMQQFVATEKFPFMFVALLQQKCSILTICYKCNSLIMSIYILCFLLLHVATSNIYACARFFPFLCGFEKIYYLCTRKLYQYEQFCLLPETSTFHCPMASPPLWQPCAVPAAVS